MPTSVPNFNFVALLVTEICRESPRKLGAADLLRRPLADKFLHVATVPANDYQHTKFQFYSSICFGDMRGPKKAGAPDFARRPLADKFLYKALLLVNAYKYAKFQLPSSISYEDMEGVPMVPVDKFFTTGHSICICLPAYQISTF